MSVKEAIEKRFSTRGFKEEKVNESDIEEILLAGLHAPTACNKQEIHFTVVKGEAPILKEVEDEKNRMRNIVSPAHNSYYEAPVLILLSAEEAFNWSKVDAGIAVQSMALRAEELGLGSLIIGSIYDAMNGEKKEYFAKEFDFPSGYEFVISIAIGYTETAKQPHTIDKEANVNYK